MNNLHLTGGFEEQELDQQWEYIEQPRTNTIFYDIQIENKELSDRLRRINLEKQQTWLNSFVHQSKAQKKFKQTQAEVVYSKIEGRVRRLLEKFESSEFFDMLDKEICDFIQDEQITKTLYFEDPLVRLLVYGLSTYYQIEIISKEKESGKEIVLSKERSVNIQIPILQGVPTPLCQFIKTIRSSTEPTA